MAQEQSLAPKGTVFVSFPGASYTHASALRAAQATFEGPGWQVVHREPEPGTVTDEDTSEWISSIASDESKLVFLMDYDLLPFDRIQRSSLVSSSSYCIRKALIRKNWLHSGIQGYAVKNPPKDSRRSALDYLPHTWSIDIQFADDLDELLIDDLYDLAEEMQRNEEREPQDRKWWILKAAMADRGMGIRIFSSLEELQGILEQFEGDSDDEEQDEEEVGVDSSDPQKDTSVMLGQLRHFIIQEYIHPPLLLAPNPISRPQSFRKFHLRAYVLCVGGLQVYLWNEMLALFAPSDYSDPRNIDDAEGPDPRIHLTNTCLHSDGSATLDGRMSEDNVHLLSDLCAETSKVHYRRREGDSTSDATLNPSDLAELQRLAVETIGTTFAAAAKGSGSTNWHMWANCWEIFGVDLLVGWQGVGASAPQSPWKMWLLEINAQPDFAQSGPKLQRIIDDLFKRSLEIAVCQRSDDEETQAVGETREGMTLCYSEKLRGAW